VEIDTARRIHIKQAPDGYATLRMDWMQVPSRLALGVPLDINQASIADLSLVPGISEILAERIVMMRERIGGFSTFDDLRGVKGIGPVTVMRLQPFLTLTTEH
jgi:competence ComEA-like helix-hairpin-helix protein